MNLDEHGQDAVDAQARVRSFEALLLPSPEGSNPTLQFFDALCLLASLIVALPAYLAMSVALVIAFYIRCAGVLLGAD